MSCGVTNINTHGQSRFATLMRKYACKRKGKQMATRKTIEGARIVFRNFVGREGQYNREGDRNFAVLLDDKKLVKQLLDEGWNVKTLSARDESEEDQPYIQVSVNYKGRPPKIVLLSNRGGRQVRTDLGEDEVEILDWIEIANVDLILNPYEWSVSGKSGIKAYLKSMFVTMDEDELDQKYNAVPYANEEDENHEAYESED